MHRRPAHGLTLGIREGMLQGIVETPPVAQVIAFVVKGLVTIIVLDHDLGLRRVLWPDTPDHNA
ncbi:hypothetical protein D3C76_1192860 [compost metagenome]